MENVLPKVGEGGKEKGKKKKNQHLWLLISQANT